MSHTKLYFRKIIGRTFGRMGQILKVDVDDQETARDTFSIMSITLLFKKDGQIG